ncbi:helix-turn-helix transcriptional regulator [Pseudovibrio sp. POLY-S9]|uniref:helix-turn-helix domain-containing protein n=1 Tax=Pseudovibrio sp. POLY-S9 TaxID=1576596 RepID=UPI0007096F6E|nr:helix-turn-helix transcriptional regulator [Pseudovibrio sp. POLY-S9]
MSRKQYKPTYLKEWRKHRNLSQQALADRMLDDEGYQLVTNVSISRIEKGLQPYTQSVLEALAEALETTPIALISSPPGEAAELINRIQELTPQQQKQIKAFLDAIST